MYEPPASRFARRVPLLLTQKGEGVGGCSYLYVRTPLSWDERGASVTSGVCAGGGSEGLPPFAHARALPRAYPAHSLRSCAPLSRCERGRDPASLYEPPAFRFALRVPLLLTQKGEGCAKINESINWGFTRAEGIGYHILFMARRARCALARLQVLCKHRTDPDRGRCGLRLALRLSNSAHDRAGKVSRRTEACSFQRES